MRPKLDLPYFPYGNPNFVIGAKLLGDEALIDLDTQTYSSELALKKQLLEEDHDHCVACPDTTLAAQWEVLELILKDLARHYPEHCKLEISGGKWRWSNTLAGVSTEFEPGNAASLPYSPLEWVGRQVQEDLLLMDVTQEAVPLSAGVLCFPSGWCISVKMGLGFIAIHDPVPGFGKQIGEPSRVLLRKITAGRSLWRINWIIKATPMLDLSPRRNQLIDQAAQAVTEQNAGDTCYLRNERQTLTLLPKSQHVLFTVRTYVCPIGPALSDPQAGEMAATLRKAPAEMLAYKGITPFLTPLLAYLDRRAGPAA